ncbi:ATPase, T2SS/T4P/T4SS family [Lacticaseibacillus thailandensis]
MYVNEILSVLFDAHVEAASDVYLLPASDHYRVVVRYPGVLADVQKVPLSVGKRWINYLKYHAGMNVSEHRRVQQGAWLCPEVGCYLRLSATGDFQNAESLVVRLIAPVPALNAVTQPVVAVLVEILRQRGLMVMTGPTGSGKTTLMYQVAKVLADCRMVMTIEDPVEIHEPEFLQLQVNAAAGMTYAALLKAALRHRPDVVVIGELRDEETALAACEAALAGHIVLATLHTRGPLDVPLRMRSLGVPANLIDGALRASAQVSLEPGPPVQPRVSLWRWYDGQETAVQVEREDGHGD